ncbi:four-carbon acid sugar kinase family protein [bacterium]|nr:four-carbon acid sugar kinase family protein [bacterium]
MIINSNITGIIADDLTGANDTALQFHMHGANTQILLNNQVELLNEKGTMTWAISTESRNVDAETAYHNVKEATQMFAENLKPDYFYKKIDSTIRGNIAIEVLAILEVLEWDASIIIPAFPTEGRVTIGGYHLLKGIPIERTEMARDPHSPIRESHLPTLLKSQLDESYEHLVGLIELRTVIKGAGPILMALNELIKEGKKLIVVDAVSTTDIEQVVLAMNKSDYKILPTGTAAAAQVLSNLWYKDLSAHHINKTIPELPKLVVSGSATEITAKQIKRLEECDEFENTLFIQIDLRDIVNWNFDELTERIVNNLVQNNIVIVHTSDLITNFDGFSEELLQAELTKASLAGKITDYLAELTKRVLERRQAILITLGGETSYKCCHAINATQLQLIDEVMPAIALSLDHNAQWIVTKSGNLGGINTLIDILKYFEHHE